ncbi:hypothetical protein DFQ01_109144 [Paenibacillus cellulosilyticus]|uniref:Uncharacterized protein n=1 Tax=Paenibacillus cellulosilyticus TaxID=375489 RepID=A0A2V2YTD7_9BACL|nr:hypothetical protein [Paenibacillus cellulosilyticus]PWW02519.1 hypothetical protein DFQ01_109144 [Paenibacillus cellulosilyticus]QKS47216.1 hypothetical protein HUB94_22520 [Paenibacillus cellulosilyticus]
MTSKEMKREYSKLTKTEKVLAKRIKNYNHAIKYVLRDTGILGPQLDENAESTLLRLVVEKSKLEQKVVSIQFRKRLIHEKMNDVLNEWLKHSTLEEIIEPSNERLREFKLDEDTIVKYQLPTSFQEEEDKIMIHKDVV